MQKIEQTYITFEQAKLLKKKRFNVPLSKVYNTLGELWNSHYSTMSNDDVDPGTSCVAPEQWQVVEWLRVNHGIWVTVYIMEKDNLIGDGWTFYFDYSIKQMKIGLIDIPKTLEEFNSPQEAYSAAFDYILDKLV